METQNKIKIFLKVIEDNKLSFIGIFTITFTLSFAFLYVLGLIPNELRFINQETYASAYDSSANASKTNIDSPSAIHLSSEERIPRKIIINKTETVLNIQNPKNTNMETLDSLLKNGVVHYPGSGDLSKGNIFIFGHSTRLSVVNNQAYKAFNDLNKVNIGDTVLVQSKNREYEYKINKKYVANQNDALVEFNSPKKMLTLSTCDSFVSKESRLVVTAEYVKDYPLQT
jgi:LPXTG-site transpeptidase (sortase) family protein